MFWKTFFDSLEIKRSFYYSCSSSFSSFKLIAKLVITTLSFGSVFSLELGWRWKRALSAEAIWILFLCVFTLTVTFFVSGFDVPQCLHYINSVFAIILIFFLISHCVVVYLFCSSPLLPSSVLWFLQTGCGTQRPPLCRKQVHCKRITWGHTHTETHTTIKTAAAHACFCTLCVSSCGGSVSRAAIIILCRSTFSNETDNADWGICHFRVTLIFFPISQSSQQCVCL